MSRTRPTRDPTVGTLLRKWRQARKLTQMELALEAEVSPRPPRHLSFLKTGRSRPSREMLLVVSSVNELPLRERNAPLFAAGFAPAHRETDLDARNWRRSVVFSSSTGMRWYAPWSRVFTGSADAHEGRGIGAPVVHHDYQPGNRPGCDPAGAADRELRSGGRRDGSDPSRPGRGPDPRSEPV